MNTGPFFIFSTNYHVDIGCSFLRTSSPQNRIIRDSSFFVSPSINTQPMLPVQDTVAEMGAESATKEERVEEELVEERRVGEEQIEEERVEEDDEVVPHEQTEADKQASVNWRAQVDGHPAASKATLNGLYDANTKIKCYILCVSAYACAGIGFAIYLSTCPAHAAGIRALDSITSNINQFYAGLGLSVLLTPAAILIRMLAYDMALLHPFAISSTHRTDLKDLDSLMDPGFYAMTRLFKYSSVAATVQAFLLLSGAVLVPVGTLIAYTGDHSSLTQGVASVGLPTLDRPSRALNIYTSYALEDGFVHSFSHDDLLDMAVHRFLGELVAFTGVISSNGQILGPSSSTNFSYKQNQQYEGIVTFNWTSGCKHTTDIEYEVSPYTDRLYDQYRVTFPTGQKNSSMAAGGAVALANVTDNDGNITTYYAISGRVVETTNLDSAESVIGVNVHSGSWITRVSCTPSLTWQVSRCTWRNSSMTACMSAPGTNTTQLDVEALDKLVGYMSLIPLRLRSGSYRTFKKYSIIVALMFDPYASNTDNYRIPSLADFNSMYGLVARSIIELATSGHYGSAEVPVIATTTRPTYLVRTYMLGIVVAILVLVPLLVQCILLWRQHRCVPMRRATLLTIANSIRGARWDSIMQGGSIMSHTQLKERHAGFLVLYGIDPNSSGQVGFFEDGLPINKAMLLAADVITDN